MSIIIHNVVIPSFYGRLYAISSSFTMIAERMYEEGKRAERGVSQEYNNVSDTLDFLELLFLYGNHPDLLVEHITFQPSDYEWGKMMEKDLKVDEVLERHAKDWILISWQGQLIGGTSPYTLVYTVPDIRKRNIRLRDRQGRYLFDGHNQPLTKRDLLFQQYMVSLYRNQDLPTSLKKYLEEIEKLLTHDPVIRGEDFVELPVFRDISGLVVNGVCLKCTTDINKETPQVHQQDVEVHSGAPTQQVTNLPTTMENDLRGALDKLVPLMKYNRHWFCIVKALMWRGYVSAGDFSGAARIIQEQYPEGLPRPIDSADLSKLDVFTFKKTPDKWDRNDCPIKKKASFDTYVDIAKKALALILEK